MNSRFAKSGIFLFSTFAFGLFFSNLAFSKVSWDKTPISIYRPIVKIASNPEIGLNASAEVGNTLISKSKTLTIPTITVASSIVHKIADGNSLETSSGTYVAWGQSGDQILYKAPGGVYRFPGLFYGETVLNTNSIGLIAKPSDGISNQIFLSLTSDQSSAYFSNLALPIEIGHDDVIVPDKMNFKQELVYTGVSKNIITIVYREYVNDFARPAFSTELKYDLTEGDIIGYKGARFQVLKATNIGVDYKVLKHLD